MTHAYEGIPPVILSGVGRSGTTAVREALGRHGQVHSTGTENNILYELLHAAAANCTVASRRYAMQVDNAGYDAAFRRLVLELLWPRPRSEHPQRLLAFTALSPTRADYLCRLFPGAQILYLVRNGIEVVTSRQRYASFAERPFREHCAVWALAVKMIDWGRHRDDFTLIRHEQLPEAIDGLWPRLGLAPDPAPARYLRENRPHPTGPDDAPRWTPRQREVFTEVCGGTMASLGYPIPWTAVTRRACAR